MKNLAVISTGLKTAIAVSSLIFLTACGGGGGSSAMMPQQPSEPTANEPQAQTLALFTELSQHGDLAAGAVAALRSASNSPASVDGPPGTVGIEVTTQSSTHEDRAHADITIGATADENTYSLSIGRDGETLDQYDVFLDSSSSGVRAINLGRPYEASSFQEVIILNDGTDRSAMIAHDKMAGSEEYFSWGMWVQAPDLMEESSDSSTFEYAAYAQGSHPYSQEALVPLTGTATYEGQAIGVALIPDKDTNPFVADVALAVDFGDDQGEGLIEGTVDNFRYQNGDGPISDFSLLEDAIGDNAHSSGSFYGDALWQAAGLEDVYGYWGGQFYGPSTGRPAAAAGTFVIDQPPEDDPAGVGWAMMGAFKADIQ
ncbi:MAG: hypothetical protein V6Z81_07595 [Parvularculales bacterium]